MLWGAAIRIIEFRDKNDAYRVAPQHPTEIAKEFCNEKNQWK
jgi:hypothetical protein